MTLTAERAPTKILKGKDLEELVVFRTNQYRESGFGSFHRPGVHAITQERFTDGTVKARLIASLPDFQGVFGRPQREAVFDCKVCSAASMDLTKYRMETKGARARQLKFMYERESFGSLCFMLIHWNARKLKTKSDPAQTFAIPVGFNLPFWQMFEAGEEKSINRAQCCEYGIEVPWVRSPREKSPRPDLKAAILELASK